MKNRMAGELGFEPRQRDSIFGDLRFALSNIMLVLCAYE